MAKILSWIAVAGLLLSALHAEKPTINNDTYSDWPRVTAASLSADGQYMAYLIKRSKDADYGTAVLRSLRDSRTKEIPDCTTQPRFVNSGAAVVIAKGSLLTIIMLSADTKESIREVSSYKTPSGRANGWLAYQTGGAAGPLVLRNLSTGTSRELGRVGAYQFDDNGRVLLYETTLDAGKKAGRTLNWLELDSGKVRAIWTGQAMSGAVFSADGTRLAFIDQTESEGQPQRSIQYYDSAQKHSMALVDSRSLDLPQHGSILDREIQFADGGERLLFFVRSEPPKNAVRSSVSVDVWSYFGPNVDHDPRPGTPGGQVLQCVVRVEGREPVFVLGAQEEILAVRSSAALVRKVTGNEWEWNWNPRYKADYALVSLRDGSRTPVTNPGIEPQCPLFETFMLSPSGRYVLCRDQTQKAYYALEAASGRWRKISGDQQLAWRGNISGQGLDQYLAARFEAWLGADAVLVSDDRDLWQLDLAGKQAPVNITGGLGVREDLRFQLLHEKDFDPSVREVPRAERGNTLLCAFDGKSKSCGYYELTGIPGEEPRRLSMGPYLDSWYGVGIVKATDANVFALTRENTETSPNLFWTDDFKDFHKVTALAPEARYNWMTSELVQWRTFKGHPATGVLYKPANFAPQKRYPLVFQIYENDMTILLHRFRRPGEDLAGQELGIPWLVSNGYLVFCPDIHYTLGEPGPSAYDHVVSAVQHLTAMPWVDPQKIGIQGGSFGGYEVNYLITHTKVFAAAFSRAGPSDLVSGYLAGTEINMGMAEFKQMRMGATLWQERARYIENSPIHAADRVATPVLLMNNRADHTVLFEQGVEFFSALRRLGKRAWLLQYDNGGHGLFRKDDKIDLDLRIEQFFDHYLKGVPPPKWMTEGIPARLKSIETGLELDTSGKIP